MRNNWIVSYDISNPKRLRKVAKFLEGYGERIHTHNPKLEWKKEESSYRIV